MYTYGIIIASDKAYSGEREDLCCSAIKSVIKDKLVFVDEIILPDEIDDIEDALIDFCDNKNIDLILTSGGTGFSERDVTVEATENIIQKETRGISEAMRMYSLTITKRAMLSRATSGIRNKSLVINLPGSPKSVTEILDYILDPVIHGLEVLKGDTFECGKKE